MNAIRLKSRNHCPPAGFQFLQRETGFHVQTWDFGSCCRAVQAHRQANPKLNKTSDIRAIEEEVDNQNAVRVLSIPNAQSYVAYGGGSPPKSSALEAAGNAVAGAKKYIYNTVNGAKIYAEWFGEGGHPVSKEMAEYRAQTCLRCPMHVKGNFAQRWNQIAAEEIMLLSGFVRKAKLETKYDEKLMICDVCDCPMKVKVHVPLDMVMKHISSDAKGKLWFECWILLELNENLLDDQKH